SALDEVDKLKTQGPPQVNIDKYKAEDQRSRETELKTNKFWLGYLSGSLQNNDPLTELDSYAIDLQSVTPESLKLTAQKYLSGKNYIRFVLLPENNSNVIPPVKASENKSLINITIKGN
ncbi:MAG: insulinase family protein, partial [Mucilaginibacter sp.]|nr:insulinase family protein [Mucilaginibacter sp.]